MVVNYDMPSSAEDYVHRIGRTGRAGASGEFDVSFKIKTLHCCSLCNLVLTWLSIFLPTGMAYSFFSAANARMAKQIVNILQEAQQIVPPELRQYAATSGGGGGSFRSRGRGGGGWGGRGGRSSGSNNIPVGATGSYGGGSYGGGYGGHGGYGR